MGCEMDQCNIPKKIKLTYFDVRARAEGIRLNLAYAALPYEDVRLKIPLSDPVSGWLEMKPSTPWASLPILEVDGEVIGQSMTIARYVAKLTGIYGNTLLEQAKYDAVVDACQDAFTLWVRWFFENDEKIKEERANIIRENIPLLITQLENVLGKDTYFGGSKLSWADLQFYNIYEVYKLSGNGFEDMFSSSTSMTALTRNIEEIPRIKQYLSNRKSTPL